MLRKFIIVGDFNLNGIDWGSGYTRSSIEREFLNGFADLGLIQNISVATHKKGNILDILLTTSTTEKVIRKPRVKRVCYNYKKANWNNLNEDLELINWTNLLDRHDPEMSWLNFKNTLFSKIGNHIPKFTVKNEYHPPWFDSECLVKCKEKDKLHKLFKQNKTMKCELKFKTFRCEYKTLI